MKRKINYYIYSKRNKHSYLKLEIIYLLYCLKKLYFVKKKRRKMNIKEVLINVNISHRLSHGLLSL